MATDEQFPPHTIPSEQDPSNVDINEVAEVLAATGGAQAPKIVRQFAERLRDAGHLDAAATWDRVAEMMKRSYPTDGASKYNW